MPRRKRRNYREHGKVWKKIKKDSRTDCVWKKFHQNTKNSIKICKRNKKDI